MKPDLGFAVRWTIVGMIASIFVIALPAATIFYLPISRIAGEMLDHERPLTVAYVDPTSGAAPVVTKLWDMPSRLHFWPEDYLNAPQAYDGVVYVVNEYHDARLTAIDSTTQQLLWSVPVDTMTYGEMTVDDRFIYLRESAHVIAIDRRTGERVWERRMPLTGGDQVIGERLLMFDMEWDEAAQGFANRVIALDRTTGDEVWRSTVGNYFGLSEHAGTVLVMTDSLVMSLSVTNGEVQWQLDIDLPLGVRNVVVVHDDVAVVTDRDTEVVAVDLRLRSERWRVPLDPGDPMPGMQLATVSIDSVVVTDSAVLFSRWALWVENFSGRSDRASHHQQFALDQATGQPLWTSKSRTYSKPIAVGDRVFALADEAKFLVEFDSRTGEERWRIRIDDPYHNHSPDFTLDGSTIYLTNYDDVWEVRLEP